MSIKIPTTTNITSPDLEFSLVELNLTLTYEERIDQHPKALDLVEELQKSGINYVLIV
jgi:hypothetical protein